MKLLRPLLVAFVLAPMSLLATMGCGARIELEDQAAGPQVEAAIASATLADDCTPTSTGSASLGSSDSAGAAEPGKSGLAGGDCAAESPGCGGYCRQSNMQLALSADIAGAKIAVNHVYLLDAKTGETLTELKSKNVRVWSDSKYLAWDGVLASGASKISYDLSQIDWRMLSGGTSRFSGYGRLFKLQVILSVNGQERTLLSGELSREPEVAT